MGLLIYHERVHYEQYRDHRYVSLAAADVEAYTRQKRNLSFFGLESEAQQRFFDKQIADSRKAVEGEAVSAAPGRLAPADELPKLSDEQLEQVRRRAKEVGANVEKAAYWLAFYQRQMERAAAQGLVFDPATGQMYVPLRRDDIAQAQPYIPPPIAQAAPPWAQVKPAEARPEPSLTEQMRLLRELAARLCQDPTSVAASDAYWWFPSGERRPADALNGLSGCMLELVEWFVRWNENRGAGGALRADWPRVVRAAVDARRSEQESRRAQPPSRSPSYRPPPRGEGDDTFWSPELQRWIWRVRPR